ncbi:hypothetical protein B1992_12760 [Pseudoxanthomonas broegbernensis]|uniref:Uncharacterized protein n=1 Tax=Pseudoxanthomonas broegbernensis TaxID=83619 RepID=A0A7V8GKP1_9GAMM|nr:hypothetical protein [Pseudoxanthomonas broegbernensis]KAF1685247.1 hypothetical protein B1992_12760 [Pseudoxanthomonas broegbernensis]MBB6066135.1 hypothetical protein [Pseudoxanthomonas broegbernensis]
MPPSDRSAPHGTGTALPSPPAWPLAAARVLGGTGAGLLVWLSVSNVLLPAPGGQLQAVASLRVGALGLALALAALALPALLRRPSRPDPWRGRALIAWGLALLAGTTMLGLQLRPLPGWTLLVALATCLCALAAVAGLALTGHGGGTAAPLRLPTRLALALLAGAAVLFALIALRWPGAGVGTGPVPSLLLLGAAAGALLLAAWHGDGGLRRGRRWLALVLLAPLPWLLALLLYAVPGWATTVWPLVAASVLAGALLEQRQGGMAAG